MSQPEGAQSVVAAAVDRLGGLDTLVNNAGIDVSEWPPVHEWDVEAFDEVLRVNLRGPFLVAKFAIPHLLAAGSGSIVHMSSVCAITVWPRGVGDPSSSSSSLRFCSPMKKPGAMALTRRCGP